jgi:hypothetical protein
VERRKTLLRARDLTREICMFATYFAITVGVVRTLFYLKFRRIYAASNIAHFHSKDLNTLRSILLDMPPAPERTEMYILQ